MTPAATVRSTSSRRRTSHVAATAWATDSWFVLSRTESGYAMAWSSAARSGLVRLDAIYVIYSDGFVEWYDITTLVRVATGQLAVSPSGAYITDAVLADVTGDTIPEIVALYATTVVAYRISDWQQVWSTPHGGSAFAVANFDDDNAAEVDVDVHGPKYVFETDLDIGAVRGVDTDGDGIDEVVVGAAQWGDEIVFDATTLARRWQIANPEHGTTEVAVGDLNGDGKLDGQVDSGGSFDDAPVEPSGCAQAPGAELGAMGGALLVGAVRRLRKPGTARMNQPGVVAPQTRIAPAA